MVKINDPVAEFKEFKRRFKFKPRFKYGWLQLKCVKCFNLESSLSKLCNKPIQYDFIYCSTAPPPPPISLSFIYEPFPRFLTASTSWNSSSTLHISASDFLFSGSRFSRKVPENIREVCGIIDIEDRKSLSLIFMIF